MSYCRIGSESDVYVYYNGDAYVCWHCLSIGGGFADFSARHPEEMLQHLQKHQDLGERVPEYALERLRSDAAHGGYSPHVIDLADWAVLRSKPRDPPAG